MSRFPKIPLVSGDTDDDASIHLHRRVGPARPLPLRNNPKTEQHILQILSEDDADDGRTNFNQQFELFKKTGSVSVEEPADAVPNFAFSNRRPEEPENDVPIADDLDDDFEELDSDELTEVEEAEAKSAREKVRPREETEKVEARTEPAAAAFSVKSWGFWKTTGLIAATQLAVFAAFWMWPAAPQVASLGDINRKFSSIETALSTLGRTHDHLASQQLLLEKNYNELSAGLGARFQAVADSFAAIDKTLAHNRQFESLAADVDAVKASLDNVRLVANTSAFDAKLDQLNAKLAALQRLNDNVDAIKTSITQDLLDALPQTVPVYWKNDQIQFVPEFSKFLYNFVDSYVQEHSAVSWKQFLTANRANLESFVGKIVQSNPHSSDKTQLAAALNDAIAANNKHIFARFNALLDSVRVDPTNISIPTTSSNRIVLDNLIDIFAKGSVSVNYADYKLGARILGFLTSGRPDSKSVGRRLFLGWYDFLANSSPSPKDLKYNANNALLDGGEPWKCAASQCNLGIRLSNSIILTDLVLKNANPSDYTPASTVSVYIKPKTRAQHDQLMAYLKEYKVKLGPPTDSKYLAKFVKVKETQLDPQKSVNHITIAKSLINMRIPIRDVYVELRSNNGNTGIFNVKAYGVTEYNSYKYGEEFDLLIDDLTKHNDDHITIVEEFDYGDAPILGDEIE